MVFNCFINYNSYNRDTILSFVFCSDTKYVTALNEIVEYMVCTNISFFTDEISFRYYCPRVGLGHHERNLFRIQNVNAIQSTDL